MTTYRVLAIYYLNEGEKMSVSILGGGSNAPNAAARCKTRRGKLLDRTQLRQLIQQSPEQLATSVADKGYRNEIDLYSTRFTGSDLLEMALTHKLSKELNEVSGFCQGELQKQVGVYVNRFSYYNAKVILRAIQNNISAEELSHDILPEENEWNTNWLEIVRSSTSLSEAASAMSSKPWGRAIVSLDVDATLANYEDALDRHYYKESITALKSQSSANTLLRRFLRMEIDHNNIMKLFEGKRQGLSSELIENLLLPNGKLIPTGMLKTVATTDENGILEVLRKDSRFDIAEFEKSVEESSKIKSLDPIMMFLNKRSFKILEKMSYLSPLSALPVVHYLALIRQEVRDIRMIVRGLSVGLDKDLLDAHIGA